MKSHKLRKVFLDFFKSKSHKIVDSAPMVLKDDITLMFTNAGMNQFKDIFLDFKNPSHLRIANSQKCLRVAGKHNDLEEVGKDTYHHTMFEMLGSWSFGDYFKKEAFEWAFEFLTQVLKIDSKNLYFTIFEGCKEDNLDKDKESFDIWSSIIKNNLLSDQQLILGSREDNFWEMGTIGPCGESSEIHIDLRSFSEKKQTPGYLLVNKGHPLVIEIWNLVFIQFFRNQSGELKRLSVKHVDTGMGFERLAMIVQNKTSSYDTDIFLPLIKKLEILTHCSYEYGTSNLDIAFRVIVDHIRAVAFAIAEGQLPGNIGAGYVLRRILRRAIRYAFSFLNQKQAFIFHLVDILVEQMGEHYKELEANKELIKKVIQQEEISFLNTLEKGIEKFKQSVKKELKFIDGKDAFELYDTFGFPIDLTLLMAKEKNIKIDIKGFENCLKQQRNRSKKSSQSQANEWIVVSNKTQKFVGYKQLESECRIIKYQVFELNNKRLYKIIIDNSPFYPEGGGQLGDIGELITKEKEIFKILDTKKEYGLIVQTIDRLPKSLETTFIAKVDKENRIASTLNHTATHLLHQSLRSVLGSHVQQKGSLVNAEGLRFDFQHFEAIDTITLCNIERLVNEYIRSNHPKIEKQNMPIAEAQKRGALMLFGEKYGDTVRYIEFGKSKELCGGTHVQATGEIGLFRIVKESSIASGVRRIEALTGQKALEFDQKTYHQIQDIQLTLNTSKDLIKAVESLKTKSKDLEKQIAFYKKKELDEMFIELHSKVIKVGGCNYLNKVIKISDIADLKPLCLRLSQVIPSACIILGASSKEKSMVCIAINKQLTELKGVHAGKTIQLIAKQMQGGGGGQAHFATAGGLFNKNLSNILKIVDDVFIPSLE